MKNIMKAVAVTLVICMAFVGCADKASDLVLGNYKGLKMTEYNTEVTQEDINNAIAEFLKDNATYQEVTDRPAAEGDKVVIDFEGFVDGEAFNGGTATDYPISSLGAGGFIDGFEEGIIGKNTGDKFVLNLKFPDPYENSPDLAGKDVDFNITLKSISESVLPEYTDETVDTYAGFKTVAEYEENLKAALKSDKEKEAKDKQDQELWNQLIEGSEVKSYPQDKIDAYIDEMKSYFQNYADLSGLSYLEFLNRYTGFKTEEEADAYMLEEAQLIIKNSMVIEAFVKAEKLSYTEKEYSDFIASYAEENGMTAEDVEAYYAKEDIEEAVYFNKIIELLRTWATVEK